MYSIKYTIDRISYLECEKIIRKKKKVQESHLKKNYKKWQDKKLVVQKPYDK